MSLFFVEQCDYKYLHRFDFVFEIGHSGKTGIQLGEIIFEGGRECEVRQSIKIGNGYLGRLDVFEGVDLVDSIDKIFDDVVC